MDVLCTSPRIPPEWIKAHGLEPRGLWNLAGAVTPKARGQGTCAYAEGCLECATLRLDCPVIFDTRCDQLRRAFDVLQVTGGSRSFLFNLPATWQAPPACRIFRSELDRLSRWLQTLGGAVPDQQRLLQVIDEFELERCRVRAALERCGDRGFAEAVARSGSRRNALGSEVVALGRPAGIPLALLGAHLPPEQWELLDFVERWGGRIVLNTTTAGERGLAETGPSGEFDRREEAPIDFLVRRYGAEGRDIFRRPNSLFYDWLQERIRIHQIRGIVVWSYVNCDLWKAEVSTLKEVLGRPVCLLEEDTLTGCSPRNLNRIQAFLEVLR